MIPLGKLHLPFFKFLSSNVRQFSAELSNAKTRQSIMNASRNTLVFFANSSDLTPYFRSQYCNNVDQGTAIKNFVKKYPDAIYTTARISGEEYMVI